MARLQLVKATDPEGVWDRLRKSWEKQLQDHGASSGWAEPQLDHATSIINQPEDHRYGIYVACGSRDGAAAAPYEGFVHINFKLINTSGAEIRLVWNRIAPRYQFEDLRSQVAEIQATFLSGALDLSARNPKKPPVKMFLGNPIDQAFGRNFALIASSMPAMRLNAFVRSNWLHISWPSAK